MKKWSSPSMKVFSVKMDENIAASGAVRQKNPISVHVYRNSGNSYLLGTYWYYLDSSTIVETNVVLYNGKSGYGINEADVAAISSCQF